MIEFKSSSVVDFARDAPAGFRREHGSVENGHLFVQPNYNVANGFAKRGFRRGSRLLLNTKLMDGMVWRLGLVCAEAKTGLFSSPQLWQLDSREPATTRSPPGDISAHVCDMGIGFHE